MAQCEEEMEDLKLISPAEHFIENVHLIASADNTCQEFLKWLNELKMGELVLTHQPCGIVSRDVPCR